MSVCESERDRNRELWKEKACTGLINTQNSHELVPAVVKKSTQSCFWYFTAKCFGVCP